MPRAKAKVIAGDSGDHSQPRKGARGKKAGVAAQMMEAETEMPVIESETTLVLPDSLDSSSAANIKDLLLARRGSPLVVDARQVHRVGIQALQVLIAAAQTWRADGQSYKVTNPSSELLETLALVGLSGDQFLLEGSSP
ncbi:STAS domain-containing protein [Hyphomicrobium sp. 99]|uniref:STAS domain-containing protein n=1 Tax=Hyphomicrobium sp. 99 TaxID=1163419 RepID=UPI0006978894|nr:STAS domain-containing protein [Hyphomicrobium sp. 99]